MFLQIGRHLKGFVAHVTGIQHCGRVMFPFVTGKHGPVSKTFVTNVALERFLAGVNPKIKQFFKGGNPITFLAINL